MGDREGSPAPEGSHWVVALDGHGVANDAVGGKAAAVDRLIAAGFRVPACAAVTADAYRRFIGQDPIREVLENLPAIEDVDDTEAEAERIAKRFTDVSIPSEIVEAIAAAVDSIAGASGTPDTVAARSSATVEDAASASYAGQFATELGCPPGEPVLDAIRRVWSSAWTPAVRAYRDAVGDAEDLAMGVLLMDMLDARHAGVVFTCAPENDERLRIETVEGLGEQLVSGEVTPELTLLSRADPGADLDGDAPGLFLELAETALTIEREFDGVPQDIEWAHDGDELWIVQARPITVDADHPGDVADDTEAPPPDDGFDTPTRGRAHTPSGVREMLPGVVPPLVWTLTAPRLEEAFRSLFAGLGALPVDDLREGHRFVGRFRGRAALDLDLLRAAARMLVGQSEAELERQYFGEIVSPDLREDEERPGGGIRALVPLWRTLRLRSARRREAQIVNAATKRLLDHRPALNPLPVDELVRYHHAVLDLAARVISAEVAVAALAAAAYRSLEMSLERLGESEAAEVAQRLTAGAIPVCKATALEVCDLLDAACEEPALARCLARGDEDDILERVRDVEGGDAFLDDFFSIIDRAGSARVFAGESWRDRPGAALSTVRQALRRLRRDELDPKQRLDELERRLTSTWQWRASRVYTGQLVDVRIRLVRRAVDNAIDLLRLREETKRTVLRLGGETRRIIEHVADQLVERGTIDTRSDIELYSHDELLHAMADRDEPAPTDLDDRRRAREQMESLGSLPARFEDRPGTASPSRTQDGNVLRGWGAGPGRHAGRPVVVTDQQSADLREGDVLVATSTDPSWTPLFVTAGAVVVEEGGPLSHAAIVAREFGLPAVLNVPGSTERLRDVSEVVVDGTRGTVEILEGGS